MLIGGTMKNLPKTFTKLITRSIDFIVADRGYSYCTPRKFTLVTPKRCTVNDYWKIKVLNSMNANFSREVTAIRNVVEHIIGIFQLQWKKLAKKVNLYHINKLYKVLTIFAAIRNIFFMPLRKDSEITEMFSIEFCRRRTLQINSVDLKEMYHHQTGWKSLGKGEQVLENWVEQQKWLPEVNMNQLHFLLLGMLYFYINIFNIIDIIDIINKVYVY